MTPRQRDAIRSCARAAFRAATDRAKLLGPFPRSRRWALRDMRDALIAFEAGAPLAFSIADLERAKASAIPVELSPEIARMREEAAKAGLELERFEQIPGEPEGVIRPIWRKAGR